MKPTITPTQQSVTDALLSSSSVSVVTFLIHSQHRNNDSDINFSTNNTKNNSGEHNNDSVQQKQQQQQQEQNWETILGLDLSSSSSLPSLSESITLKKNIQCHYHHHNCTNYDAVIDRSTETSTPLPLATQHYNTFDLGIIIDNNHPCNSSLLKTIDNVRTSLVLDSKRPTVHRRFYHDTTHCIVHDLERILYDAISSSSLSSSSSSLLTNKVDTNAIASNTPTNHNIHWFIYCNRYIRILEYTTMGSELLPHTDGIKICDTTHIKSTHTLLLYLTDCNVGGETVVINPNCPGWSKYTNINVPFDRIYRLPIHQNNDCTGSNTDPRLRYMMDTTNQDMAPSIYLLGISPKVGRLFVFPHDWPHAGAMIESIPKIVLRAEVTIQYFLS